jgi:hypothetical protein
MLAMAAPVQYRVSKQLQLNTDMVLVHGVNPTRWFTVKTILVTNHSLADKTVQLCFVPRGGLADSSNMVFGGQLIPASDFIQFGDGAMIEPGGAIFARASALTAVNIFVSGIEEQAVGV